MNIKDIIKGHDLGIGIIAITLSDLDNDNIRPSFNMTTRRHIMQVFG